MSWSGDISTGLKYTSDTSKTYDYTLGSYTAPSTGLYQFELFGSGGEAAFNEGWKGRGDPGIGGYTRFYIALEAGQVLYFGVGGPGSCAFIANSQATSSTHSLSTINANNVIAVAGGGGSAGYYEDTNNRNGYNCITGHGGNGGGTTGQDGYTSGQTKVTAGSGGTQTGIGSHGNGAAYGIGGSGAWSSEDKYYASGGIGGDGWFGGGCSEASAVAASGSSGASYSNGGGGGSSYYWGGLPYDYAYGGVSHSCYTTAGGGSTSNGYIIITYSLPTITKQPTITSISPATKGRSATIAWSEAGVSNLNGGSIIYQYFVGPSTTYSDDYCLGETTGLAAFISQAQITSKCGTDYPKTVYFYVRAYWKQGDSNGGWIAPTGVAWTYDPRLPVAYNGVQPANIAYNGTIISHLVYNGTQVF